MVTMIDEIYDRHYREGRDQLNAAVAQGLGRFSRAIQDAFEVLVGIEYSEPWATKPERARCN